MGTKNKRSFYGTFKEARKLYRHSLEHKEITIWGKLYYWSYVATLLSYITYWIYLCVIGYGKLNCLGPVTYLLGTGFSIQSFFIEFTFFVIMLHQVISQTESYIARKN